MLFITKSTVLELIVIDKDRLLRVLKVSLLMPNFEAIIFESLPSIKSTTITFLY